VNWAEGMPPSAVNDSARAMMASTAAYRDDVAGAITTGGTSTAYTVTSYQIFSSLTVLNGQCIAFVPHATNGATVTLNVDGLGAKPLRSAPSVELVAGTLIQGTPYTCTYNSSDAVFYLRDFYINPYVVPIGGMIDFWGASVPSSSFVFPIGQAISRTTYSALFTLFSTTYGTGDGSTTFNVPDVTGRVTAMKEASATRLTSTYFGGTSTSLGAVGGLESHTLTTAQLASHSHGVTDSGHTHGSSAALASNFSVGFGGGAQGGIEAGHIATISSATTGISINNAGSGSAHNNVQPTIICNKLLRVI
jgi:microcystin-dependent protein